VIVLDFIKGLDPYAGGVIVLGLVWLIVGVLTGSMRVWRVALGVDGRFSTSKLQQFVWTAAVLFSYSCVFAARIKAGRLEPIAEIPPNVLLALGFSVGTAILATGITSDHVETGKEVKTASGASAQGARSLVEDDAGRLDLAKLQLLAWTLIAIFAYLLATVDAVEKTVKVAADAALPGLPDIDSTLMVLTGLGQGAYIGKKLVTRTTSGLTGLNQASATPGTTIAATGVGLGDERGASLLTMNDFPIPSATWGSTTITFDVPAAPPWGGAWTGQKVRVNVVVDGQLGANAVYLVVKPPAT
jgi:hypothetical protein